jgi:hypothetical protein
MAINTRFPALLAVVVLGIAVSSQQPPATPSQPAAQPQAPAAQSPSRILPPPAGWRLTSGVTYVYKAEWRLLDAGVATLRLDPEPNGMQRVTATAKSTGFVGSLYRVADTFEAVFDPRTFCSSFINKRTEEGRRKRNVEIRFDYQRKKSVVEDTNLRSGQKKMLESEIPPCVTDVLSGLIYAATLRLEPGAVHVFPVNDGKTVDLTARVEAREELETDAGTFKTVRVQPQVPIGPLKSKGKLWIWYSEEGERIPVQIRGRLFWGTLTLKLMRIERTQTASTAGASQ